MPKTVRCLLQDDGGVVAVVFALVIIPLMIMLGLSVDMAQIYANRQRMQNLVDSANIAFSHAIKQYLDTNGNLTANFNSIYSTEQTNIASYINSQAGLSEMIDSVSPQVTATFDGTNINSTVGLTYNSKTYFMNILGMPSVPVSISAKSTASVAKFIQVIFLVDVSSSMGVGATQQDINALKQNFNCEFGCHASAASGDNDIEPKAHAQGIKLKIDYAQSAISTFVSNLKSMSTVSPNHYWAGIYTFSGTLHNVLQSTSDYTNILSAVNAIDLDPGNGNTPCASFNCGGWTDISNALTNILPQIKNVGDGSSTSSMLTYLVFVSDGVEDIYLNGSGFCCGHYTDASWSSNCTPIKQKGIQIATVQAVYVPFPAEWQYVSLVQPFINSIPTAMSNCASSSSMALSASDGPGLATAIASLFGQIVFSPRLTN